MTKFGQSVGRGALSKRPGVNRSRGVVGEPGFQYANGRGARGVGARAVLLIRERRAREISSSRDSVQRKVKKRSKVSGLRRGSSDLGRNRLADVPSLAFFD